MRRLWSYGRAFWSSKLQESCQSEPSRGAGIKAPALAWAQLLSSQLPEKSALLSPAAARHVSESAASLAERTAAFRASAWMLTTFLSRSPRPRTMEAISWRASILVCLSMYLHYTRLFVIACDLHCMRQAREHLTVDRDEPDFAWLASQCVLWSDCDT